MDPRKYSLGPAPQENWTVFCTEIILLPVETSNPKQYFFIPEMKMIPEKKPQKPQKYAFIIIVTRDMHIHPEF